MRSARRTGHAPAGPARRGAGDITAVDHALLAHLAHDGRASRQALSTDLPPSDAP
ncbi:hypothetical protein GQF42_35860 [Streptomyces broussonetiae]|uniref:AsnC family transcriptional regulator n=1 Tax=Streptomyces broussonetiae TaxID=2686304 RepID=A0A6I6N531_9ACTN|nr:hypothetical protein [Streptomyces broussonetiae]QHA07943.1 hypothetical protein GQF42_35860 [Streptomyces broussonetiae]